MRAQLMKRAVSVFLAMLIVVCSAIPVVAEDAQPTAEQINKALKVVNNVGELETAVANAAAGDTITLSDTFVSGNAVLTMPAVEVTIEGNDQVWDLGNITVNGNAGGQLTLQNLQVSGAGISNRLIKLQHQIGKVILKSMTISGGTQGAIEIGAGASAETLIENTLIQGNTSVNSAPAVRLADNINTKVEISYSSIVENIGTGGGYETGAIASKSFAGQLDIHNTLFQSNYNKSLNTGVLGGGGGAIAMHYMTGQMNINESIFRDNRSNGEGIAAKETYDGGAIYIFDGQKGAVVNINRTTFDSNIAWDDGGAIMFQGAGSPGLTTNISNSTFYNNHGYGLNGGNLSGGAIQYFKNGTTSRITSSISGSTFVGNTAGSESSTVDQKGGALALSGGGTLPIPATVTRTNTLFIGNQVYGANGAINTASSYKDVSDTTTTQLDTNIVNADKGATPAYTAGDVFGSGGPVLSNNLSGIKAGVDMDTIQTLPIKPAGLAENTSATVVTGLDQRNYERYKDIGAVEVSWIKYDANGGTFQLSPMTSYDGSEYYELQDDGSITQYNDVGYAGGASTVKTQADLNAVKGNYELIGWSTDPAATTPDVSYGFGAITNYVAENLTLYAVWRELPAPTVYHVTYDANSGTGTPPVDTKDYVAGDNVTVAGKGDLAKENYTFIGWNTKPDGSGTSYAEGDRFVIDENVVLYAMWEKVDPPVEPDEPEPTPVEPDKPQPPKDNPVKPEKNKKSAATGDMSNENILFLLMGGALIVILVARKKYKAQQ